MGGQAFAHLKPPLFTPRMPPGIYQQVLASTHALLQQHFSVVRSAIEAPEKETYGDIDILVFGPLPSSPLNNITSRPEEAVLLSRIIGAKHHIVEKGSHSINFAIPWPELIDEVGMKIEHKEDEGISNHETDMGKPKHIQVDLTTCSSLKILNWSLFHSAHGDLWNILGSTIRRFGLTVNNLGMYIRIPDLETRDRKKSMVFLTDDPGKILEFLRLEEDRWWRSFGSREEMFEYAAGVRFFWVKDEEENGDGVVGDWEGLEGGAEGKKKLKNNDRQRMGKRPIFREWIEVFIPKCREEGRFMDVEKLTREQIRDEAFEFFGSEVKSTWQAKERAWRLETHTDHIWRMALKGSVPEEVDPQFRAAAIRILKGVVMEGETFDGKTVPEVAQNEEGFWDTHQVEDWVAENWKKAGAIGWKRQQAKAAEGNRVKAEKKSIQQEEADRK